MSYSELVIEGYQAWNAGNREWILEHMTSEVEWVQPEADPDAQTYLGTDDVERFWDQWRAAVGQLHFELLEVTEQGSDVVVLARREGQGSHSGLQVSDEVVQVFSFNENGKCHRVREFYDREEAARTLGLPALGRSDPPPS
jgi:ketosteroid isomerase-like protein